MKKYFHKIIIIGVVIFLLVQLYQPARNKSYEQDSSVSFTNTYVVPQSVKNILFISCYDCHSNNTNYQWYDLIQPARMFVEMHIAEAKDNINFDEWGHYSKRKQANKLDRISKQIKANEMPLISYTLIHRNAKLSEVQKMELIDWISNMEEVDTSKN